MPDGGGIRLRLGINLTIVTRAKLLARVAKELGAAADLEYAVLETIEQAINEHLLATVYVEMFADGSTEPDAFLVLSIDWERHLAILSDTSSKVSFEINVDATVTGQFSEMLDTIKHLILAKVEDLDIVHSEVAYMARPGKQQEFRKRFNTVGLSPERVRRLEASQAKLRSPGPGTSATELTDSDFGEATVSFWYRDRPLRDR
jgi:hypothetical protein